MELLVWMWAFDKRVFCGIRYGSQQFVYIWLIPVILSISVLFLSWLDEF